MEGWKGRRSFDNRRHRRLRWGSLQRVPLWCPSPPASWSAWEASGVGQGDRALTAPTPARLQDGRCGLGLDLGFSVALRVILHRRTVDVLAQSWVGQRPITCPFPTASACGTGRSSRFTAKAQGAEAPSPPLPEQLTQQPRGAKQPTSLRRQQHPASVATTTAAPADCTQHMDGGFTDSPGGLVHSLNAVVNFLHSEGFLAAGALVPALHEAPPQPRATTLTCAPVGGPPPCVPLPQRRRCYVR